MKNVSILVVEDDQALNQQISDLLHCRGYEVEQSFDGEHGLKEALKGLYDLIVLDVMLPKRDGFSLLSLLRNTHETPVIMVSAKGAEEERIKGFQQGTDDYLAKPFNSKELLLRIDALLRRSKPQLMVAQKKLLEIDGLQLDLVSGQVIIGEQLIELTTIQFSLLMALMKQPSEVLSKPYLYQTVLKKSYGTHDRSLDMHLSRVRRKLSLAGWQGSRLQTVHGKGYCIA